MHGRVVLHEDFTLRNPKKMFVFLSNNSGGWNWRWTTVSISKIRIWNVFVCHSKHWEWKRTSREIQIWSHFSPSTSMWLERCITMVASIEEQYIHNCIIFRKWMENILCWERYVMIGGKIKYFTTHHIHNCKQNIIPKNYNISRLIIFYKNKLK